MKGKSHIKKFLTNIYLKFYMTEKWYLLYSQEYGKFFLTYLSILVWFWFSLDFSRVKIWLTFKCMPAGVLTGKTHVACGKGDICKCNRRNY